MVAVDMPSFLPSVAFSTREGMRGNDGSTKESGVKAFVNGMMTPFTSCWQPPLDSCAPAACSTSRYTYFEKQPAVVSPGGPGNAELPTSPIGDVHSPRSERNDATDVETSQSTDVLCGRGGSSNRHLGNMHFRELVAANKNIYVGLTKKQKMLVARKIVNLVGQTQPPGRFLAKDSHTGRWYDIGLPRSLEKTSQALREKNSNDVQGGAPSGASVSTSQGPASEDTRASKGVKGVEAPPLVVPPHLTETYYPRKVQETDRSRWSKYEPQFQQIQQPYLRSRPSSCPTSPSQGYHVAPRVRRQRYNESPKSPHYGSPLYAHPESPPRDYRDHHDYYPRTERYYSQSRHIRLQPPRRYQPYPQTPIQQRIRNHYHQSPRMVAGVPPRPMAATLLRFDEDPSGYGRPYLPSMPPQSTALSPTSGPPPMYRTPSNGYVRGRSDVSSERRQEWNRQRNESGLSRRLSEASLSTAVKDSLSLEESGQSELKSPSGLLQGRSHRSTEDRKSSNAQNIKHGGLSGLAALSTAAFLKLDNASS